MQDTFKGIEPLVYESQINVPYRWWAGDTASRFFSAIREEKKILGTKCSGCTKVYIPPRKVCPSCFTQNQEWVEVSDEGVLQSYTVARRQLPALPSKAPVAFGLIRLDGADTSLLHFLGEVDEKQLRLGLRVKAAFAEDRKGGIRDIAYFRPLKQTS